MPRTSRAAIGGLVYHVLNRGNGRLEIFRKPGDFLAFCDLMVDAREQADIEVFGFCLMSNHWHLVVRPRRDQDLARYFSWLTNTHLKRYRAHYRRTSGHLYQGRYKSFVVQEGWAFADTAAVCGRKKLLDDWPIDRPRNWTALVNEPIDPAAGKRVEVSFERGRPLGSDPWTLKMAGRMGLQYTLNPRGRPKLPEGSIKTVDVT